MTTGLLARERVGRFGRMALKHVKYHVLNELPVKKKKKRKEIKAEQFGYGGSFNNSIYFLLFF